MRPIWKVLAILLLAVLACGQGTVAPPGDETVAPATSEAASLTPAEPESERRCSDGVCDGPETAETCPADCAAGAESTTPASDFGFGVEYGNVTEVGEGRAPAHLYAMTGATWVKLANVTWNATEPDPPQNGQHNYDWSALDALVAEWQAGGFDLQMVLRCKSEWGTAETTAEGLAGLFNRMAATPPKEDYWDDYGAWVGALVERYDGDGLDDMPGLLRPIHHYEIESEAAIEAFWQGTVEEYGRLLRTAYPAAHAADPQVQIILSGVNALDLFDDEASVEVMEARFEELLGRMNAEMRPAYERGIAFQTTMFDYGDAFDLVEFHALSDYRGIPGTAAYFRSLMAARGYQKPIWAGDAASAPTLAGGPRYFNVWGLHALQYLGILANPDHARFAETEAWYRAGQARLTVKKLVVSMATGLGGINIGNLEDWPVLSGFPFHGLVDGEQQPRPVMYSYALVTEKLAGFTDVEQLDLGAGVYAYRFTMPSGPVTVLWYDDYTQQMVGDPEPSTQVSLPVDGTEVTVTEIITTIGQTEPDVEQVAAAGGVVTLMLAETPVFVEMGR